MSGTRPIVFVDVDEVILDFVQPFISFLEEKGLDFIQDRFARPHNIVCPESGKQVSPSLANRLLDQFWDEQETRQTIAPGTIEALNILNAIADIVILTAVSPKHEERRRRLLRSVGLQHPMIVAAREKGAIIADHVASKSSKVFLIDDAPANHASLMAHVPRAIGVHLASFKPFIPLMSVPSGIYMARDWSDAASFVQCAISGDRNMG